MIHDEIKPCPFCGNSVPWTYHGAWAVQIGCSECDFTFGKPMRTVYKLGEEPPELTEFLNPANALVVDGKEFPEHGYYSVSCLKSFEYSGDLARWNKRFQSTITTHENH